MEQPTLILKKKLNPRNLEVFFGDTDSLGFKKPDEKPFTDDECDELLKELNSLMPTLIKWEADNKNKGRYKKFIIIKRKNYLLDDGKEIVVKGSGLKATMKEPALRKFIGEVLELLRTDRKDQIYALYQDYVFKIMAIGISSLSAPNKPPTSNIADWCFKKTITKSVLSPERANEARVLKALEGTSLNEGDRALLFFKTEEEYSLLEKFDGTYCKKTLLSKLYKTLLIFSTVIDTDLFPNYSLVRNMKSLGL